MSIIQVSARFSVSDLTGASLTDRDRESYDTMVTERLDQRFAVELSAALHRHGPSIVGNLVVMSEPDATDPLMQATLHRKVTAIWPLGSGNNAEREQFVERHCR